MKTTRSTALAILAAMALAAPAYAAEKKMKAAPDKAGSERTAQKTTAEKPSEKAAGDQTKTTEKPAAASKPLPYQGEIASIDPTTKSFIIKNRQGKEHTFTVTDKTVIKKADGTGSFDDVQVGEFVRGSRLKMGDARWDALTLTIGKKEETGRAPKVAAKTGAAPAAVAAPPDSKKTN